MQMRNFIQINDWDISSFFAVILSIQAACLATIVAGAVGIELPIIRPLFALIYLMFVPGYLVLRVLKMHKLGNVETPLYAVGLSVSIVMAAGLLSNIFYPSLGISQPLATYPLLATLTTIVILLCVACYIRDRDFSDDDIIEMTELASAPALFLCLLPFLSIFGTHFLTVYNNNILSLSLLITVAAVIILIGFDKFIPSTLYPLAIFSLAISLLFHTALVSMNLWGWDIQFEYYFANVVFTNGYWDSTAPFQGNSIISTLMLGPAYAHISNIDLKWVFKAVYPFLYAFVPLGLFVIFKNQVRDKIATLSILFFMSFFTFYTEMPELARQEIAELFLILILVAMFAQRIDKFTKTVLSLVFALSLILSHYALSYLTIFFLAGIFVLYKLSNIQLANKIFGYRSHFESETRHSDYASSQTRNASSFGVSVSFIVLFIVGTFAWYLYVSGSSAVVGLVSVWGDISASIFGDFLNPNNVQAVGIAQQALSPIHELARYLQYLAQLFIAIGVFSYFILKRGAMKPNKEYALLSILSFGLMILCLTVPFVASTLNTSRMYHIGLLFLAPFLVIGAVECIKGLHNPFKRKAHTNEVRGSLQAVSIFIAVFLLFNTGFVYKVLNDSPTSVWLNNAIDYPLYNAKEIQGASWLASALGNYQLRTGDQAFILPRSERVYADVFRFQTLGSVGLQVTQLPTSAQNLSGYSYVYLGTFNIEHYVYLGTLNIEQGKILTRTIAPGQAAPDQNYVNIRTLTNNLSEIYDNGGSQIYQ